jgi:hypothetical protein
VGARTSLDDVEKRKFLTVPELELRSVGRPARGQSLYRLHYPGSCCYYYLHIFGGGDLLLFLYSLFHLQLCGPRGNQNGRPLLQRIWAMNIIFLVLISYKLIIKKNNFSLFQGSKCFNKICVFNFFFVEAPGRPPYSHLKSGSVSSAETLVPVTDCSMVS